MLKNTFDFVNRFSKIDLAKDDYMVSFDVESIFTNIPVNETIDSISFSNERFRVGPRGFTVPMTRKRLIGGARSQIFLPWAKGSIRNGLWQNLPTLLGLSALFDPEIAEFTDRSEYKKWFPLCAHLIGHPMFHSRKQNILKIFGHFDPLKDLYLGG